MTDLFQLIQSLPMHERAEIANRLLRGTGLCAVWIDINKPVAQALRALAFSVPDQKQELINELRALIASPGLDPDVRVFLENALIQASRCRSLKKLGAIAAQVYGQLAASPALEGLVTYPELLSFYAKFRQCNATPLIRTIQKLAL